MWKPTVVSVNNHLSVTAASTIDLYRMLDDCTVTPVRLQINVRPAYKAIRAKGGRLEVWSIDATANRLKERQFNDSVEEIGWNRYGREIFLVSSDNKESLSNSVGLTMECSSPEVLAYHMLCRPSDDVIGSLNETTDVRLAQILRLTAFGYLAITNLALPSVPLAKAGDLYALYAEGLAILAAHDLALLEPDKLFADIDYAVAFSQMKNMVKEILGDQGAS